MKCEVSEKHKNKSFPWEYIRFSSNYLRQFGEYTLIYVIFFITKASKDEKEVIADIDMEAVKVSTG